MNERIRTLLIQAQDLARSEVENNPDIKPPYHIPATEVHKGLGLSYEKFAELIVQECTRIIANQAWESRIAGANGDWTEYNTLSRVAGQIKEHFGVE